MRYWWVNQNQTYDFEVPGGFLWSPKTRSDGGRNYFYESMSQVSPGDIVYSFCDTLIRAVGIVQKTAVTSPKPDFRKAGSNWSNVGWLVDVEFAELARPFKPKDYIEQIRPLLAEKYAPLQANGNGLQGIYLTEISQELGELLGLLSKENLLELKNELAPVNNPESDYELNLEIQMQNLEGDLEKIELTKSRRGQGIFRANVRLVEKHCRVTGVTNIKHLRASHIKPWRQSNNSEKLDGYNGLLLSPHVDHLFDRGFISFKNSGELIISSELNPKVLEQWSISKNQNVGEFKSEQCEYLDYHRNLVLIC